MKYVNNILVGLSKKRSLNLTPKKLLLSLSIPLIFGVSLHARASIFDDIGDVVGDIVDAVTSLFSSAKDLAQDVVDKIDTSIGTELSGLCSVVTASQQDGETSTINAVEQCGGQTVENIGDAFVAAGGDIAEQYQTVQDGLVEISKEQWAENSESFVELIETLNSYYMVVFDNMKAASNEVLEAMNDVKTTLETVDFPNGDLSPATNLDISYTIPLGSSSLELMIRGQTTATITEAGSNYVGIIGHVIARLKYFTPTTLYQPGVMASVIYSNPIIKYQDNKITGILVNQPDGAISLDVSALPFNFTASLDQLTSIPAVKKVPIVNVAAKAIAISVDIGTTSFTVPITGQSGNDLDFSLSISGGIEAQVNITDNWAVKVSERLGWTKGMTIDVPSWQLDINDVPETVVAQLTGESSSPSYAERILWLTFDEANTTSIINDHSSFGNHANKVGGVTLANGAATFNGTDGYIDLPDDLLTNIDEITVYAEVFINESQPSPYWIYGLGNVDGDWGSGYVFTTGNNYRSVISTCHWICEQGLGESNVNLPRGSWQKIAYSIKGNVATLYLNGDVVGIKEDVTLMPSQVGDGHTDDNFIGRSLYSADHYLSGGVRDFQIWNGALTHKEIVDVTNTSVITIQARGTAGSEKLSLIIGGVTVDTWTLSTAMAEHTVITTAQGDVRVEFTNDASDRDVVLDYVTIDGVVLQAEDQDDNTAAWDGTCGGGTKTEMMHCNGSIGFGEISLY